MTREQGWVACRPLERAELPRTVWHIAVAALIGNAWGPVYDPRAFVVVPSGRWSGSMGRAPVNLDEYEVYT